MRVDLSSAPGVYRIRNNIRGRAYIGSSVDVHARAMQHRAYLERGTHHSLELQEDWLRDGSDAFVCDVLFMGSVDDLASEERTAIEAEIAPYNRTLRTKCGNRGQPHSQDHREAIARGHRGSKRTEASRDRISLSRRRVLQPDVGPPCSGPRRSWRRRPVEQLDPDSGAIVATFDSLTAAAAAGFCKANLCAALKGRQRHHGGFHWRYMEISQ